MIQTDIGPLDGNSWESLIQLVFKKKHDTYQEMIASPGDLGIEGVVLLDGIAIQCYCPNEDYDTKTLYQKQRDKITKDIGKLSINEKDLVKHLGDCIIRQWIFITPRIAKHEIHAHARIQEKNVKEKKLEFISDDFQILIKDLDFYIHDIRQLQMIGGEQLCFSNSIGEKITEPELTTEYDDNIYEKNKIRSVINEIYKPKNHDILNELTKKNYLDGYEILRSIFNQSQELYERIAKLVNNFESEVEELSITWEDSPLKLIIKVEEKLIARFNNCVHISKIEHEDLVSITKHMVAKWIAECPMRIE